MKKVLCPAMVFLMLFVFGACSAPSAAVSAGVDEAENGAAETAAEPEPAFGYDEEFEPFETASVPPADPAVAAIVPRADTTAENPAALGEWVLTKQYSAKDDAIHDVYYRVTEILRSSSSREVQRKIDAYNGKNRGVQFDPLADEALEYCLFRYEAAYPADYPQDNWGISFAGDLRFMIGSPDGGAIKANGGVYPGLCVFNLSEAPDDFYAGNVFKDGEAIFTMVKGVSEYLITSGCVLDDKKYVSYVQGQ